MATDPSSQCLLLQRDGEQGRSGRKALRNSSFFKEFELATVHGWWAISSIKPIPQRWMLSKYLEPGPALLAATDSVSAFLLKNGRAALKLS